MAAPSHSATATLTYVDMTVPPDQVPTLWYVGLRDQAGALVGAEQTFTMPTPTATFLNMAAGTYSFWAGQRTAAGAEVGTVVKSDPFVLSADVVIKVVGTITVMVN